MTAADAIVTVCVISNAIHNQCIRGPASEHSIAASILLDVTAVAQELDLCVPAAWAG